MDALMFVSMKRIRFVTRTEHIVLFVLLLSSLFLRRYEHDHHHHDEYHWYDCHTRSNSNNDRMMMKKKNLAIVVVAAFPSRLVIPISSRHQPLQRHHILQRRRRRLNYQHHLEHPNIFHHKELSIVSLSCQNNDNYNCQNDHDIEQQQQTQKQQTQQQHQQQQPKQRNIGLLQSWCNQVGIVDPNQLIDFVCTRHQYHQQDPEKTSYDHEDCILQLKQDAMAGTMIGIVPSHCIFSSDAIIKEWNHDPMFPIILQPALELLRQYGFHNQIPQFVLFLQLLYEYQQNEHSMWYQYIQSLPQTFYTCINMNEYDTEHLLPPMAYTIAKTWNFQYQVFQQAIQLIEMVPSHNEEEDNMMINLTSSTASTTTSTTTRTTKTHAIDFVTSLSNMKQNTELLKWAYNVVFTRCWSYREDDHYHDDDDTITIQPSSSNQPQNHNTNHHHESDHMSDAPPTSTSSSSSTTIFTNKNHHKKNRRQRIDLVPLGDMFNHGSDVNHHNIAIEYHPTNGNCIISLTKDTKAGTPLLFSYGKETNTYHFLTIFGFVDNHPMEILCEIPIQLSSSTSSSTSSSSSTTTATTAGNNLNATTTTIINTSFSSEQQQQQELQQRYKEMFFYDPSKMVFRTNDGAVSAVVWDYILYTLFDQNLMIDQMEELYIAHKQNDTITKQFLHAQYHLETCILLKKHVDRKIIEMKQLHQNIMTTSNELRQQQQQQQRERKDVGNDWDQEKNNIDLISYRLQMIDLIRRNNELITNTFRKVQMRVNQLIQEEMQARRKRV
jgi:hypothetical protein